ncbi:glycosyltransferase family 20-domain-containing protein [Gorgonomyces haynaldii]|nr:glycosyltransferase family 20-domain-containing protein [Gorgonomyces haynaldii]
MQEIVPEETSPIIKTTQGNPGLYNAVNAANLKHLLWIGTVGTQTDNMSKQELQELETNLMDKHESCPVFVSKEELHGHYSVFCKQVLWKPFHYQLEDFPKARNYDQDAWNHYVQVNQKFANVICKNYKSGDVIWINDYHLMLVPEMVRRQIPQATIGFFLHIPFPSSEIFRCLHVRQQILRGLLGADLVGFQIYSYLRHFLMNCSRILALDSSPRGVQLEKSTATVGIYPIGINLDSLNEKRKQQEVLDLISFLKEKYKGKKILIGRDKNDYVKGVKNKLLAYEQFMAKNPQWHGKVVLIQVTLSTTEANEHECNDTDIVARINSRFGTIEYVPVVYLHQDISFSHYLALLTIADACLITPLRDGMNLTSHEYVVCQEEKKSPLIISEFAGTYGSFGASLRVNPWDTQEVADAILDALEMTPEEKNYRWEALYQHVALNTAQSFVETFVKDTLLSHKTNSSTVATSIPRIDFDQLKTEYHKATRRLIFVDDCGTLKKPCSDEFLLHLHSHDNDQEMRDILTKLCADPANSVYLMSGRPRTELEELMSIPNLGIAAENGCFLKFCDKSKWEIMLRDNNLNWRKKVMQVLEYYTEYRTPGSYIESKEIGLSWHFGRADKDFGSWQAAECQNHIINSLMSNYPIHTLATRKRIDVLPRNVSKATVIKRVLQYHQNKRRLSTHSIANAPLPNPEVEYGLPPQQSQLFASELDAAFQEPPTLGHMSDSSVGSFPSSVDFILCLGDDRADEFMFEYLARLDETTPSGSFDKDCTSPRSETAALEDDDYGKFKRNPSPSRKSRVIFTCTVGSKSSSARYFIDTRRDLIAGLESL